jgi:hypothetical protein
MSPQRLFLAAALFAIVACGGSPALAQSDRLDTTGIEQLTGLKGTLNEKEGVFKVSFPRKDIQATVAGARMIPDLGLTAWAAFSKAGDHVMVMGDIVLLESEVNGVMSAALDNGLEVTALHNHFVWDSPRIMFMHIGGMGGEQELARAVGQVFSKLKASIQTPPTPPTADVDPARTSFDPKRIEQIIGSPGTTSNGVYKVVLGRSARMGDHEIAKEMGVNTWAAFAGSEESAIVDGDFCMLESEVQSVLKALRGAGINIVAIHNHMVGESPRYVFLHYWGVGPAKALARGVRAALDTQAAYQ